MQAVMRTAWIAVCRHRIAADIHYRAVDQPIAGELKGLHLQLHRLAGMYEAKAVQRCRIGRGESFMQHPGPK